LQKEKFVLDNPECPKVKVVRELLNIFNLAYQKHEELCSGALTKTKLTEFPLIDANNFRRELFKYFYLK